MIDYQFMEWFAEVIAWLSALPVFAQVALGVIAALVLGPPILLCLAYCAAMMLAEFFNW